MRTLPDMARAIPFPVNGHRPLSSASLINNFTVEPLEAPASDDGFSATLRVCKQMGLDLSGVPQAILQIFYTSGVCFGPSEKMTAEQRALWRNSVVWPIKNDRPSKQVAVVANMVERKV